DAVRAQPHRGLTLAGGVRRTGGLPRGRDRAGPGHRGSRAMNQTWHAAYAWLPGGLARDVTFEIADGRFTSVTPDTSGGAASRLPGVVLPGLANAHSHAFHRALRGRTHDRGGDFWTWRER